MRYPKIVNVATNVGLGIIQVVAISLWLQWHIPFELSMIYMNMYKHKDIPIMFARVHQRFSNNNMLLKAFICCSDI